MARPLPEQDHHITRDEALRIVRALRAKVRDAAAKGVAARTQPTPVRCFHRKGIDRILNQPGCVGVRLYPAVHDDGKETLVLVGIAADGSDMADGEFVQQPVDCPPDCDENSVLHRDA